MWLCLDGDVGSAPTRPNHVFIYKVAFPRPNNFAHFAIVRVSISLLPLQRVAACSVMPVPWPPPYQALVSPNFVVAWRAFGVHHIGFSCASSARHRNIPTSARQTAHVCATRGTRRLSFCLSKRRTDRATPSNVPGGLFANMSGRVYQKGRCNQSYSPRRQRCSDSSLSTTCALPFLVPGPADGSAAECLRHNHHAPCVYYPRFPHTINFAAR